ncbi:MAG: MerR family DNA-binding transcriptional regulator [Chlamydiae bacterium]|nr:MerR family DNA-binding transcriptional regulator [Chlamydiota bacterium]
MSDSKKSGHEKSDYLTIKTAAEVLSVTPTTLRRWDKAGKLKTRQHPMNNYRIYDPVEVEALKKAILKGVTQ